VGNSTPANGADDVIGGNGSLPIGGLDDDEAKGGARANGGRPASAHGNGVAGGAATGSATGSAGGGAGGAAGGAAAVPAGEAKDGAGRPSEAAPVAELSFAELLAGALAAYRDG
jgi:hypothetical protein